MLFILKFQNIMILFLLETENKAIQEEQDRFTTCFKTCGTGSTILRGGEWVQSPKISWLYSQNINVYPASLGSNSLSWYMPTRGLIYLVQGTIPSIYNF